MVDNLQIPHKTECKITPRIVATATPIHALTQPLSCPVIDKLSCFYTPQHPWYLLSLHSMGDTANTPALLFLCTQLVYYIFGKKENTRLDTLSLFHYQSHQVPSC